MVRVTVTLTMYSVLERLNLRYVDGLSRRRSTLSDGDGNDLDDLFDNDSTPQKLWMNRSSQCSCSKESCNEMGSTHLQDGKYFCKGEMGGLSSRTRTYSTNV